MSLYYAYAFPTYGQDFRYLRKRDVPFIDIPYSLLKGNRGRRIHCGFKAEHLYFLGLSNSTGRGCGSWGTNIYDKTKDFFIGDSIGDIHIRYADGITETIPLILGFTALWKNTQTDPWLAKWDPDKEPFRSGADARRALEDAAFIVDVLQPESGPYAMKYACREQIVTEVEICSNPCKEGYPEIYAMTIADPSDTAGLIFLGEGEDDWKIVDTKVLQDHAGVYSRCERLARFLYTVPDDLKNVSPDTPVKYGFTEMRFDGGLDAVLITNEYYHCLADSMLKGGPLKCENLGFYHGIYTGGIGLLDPAGTSGGDGWTRDVAWLLTERLHCGRLAYADEGIDLLDKLFYGYGEMKPLPLPHWVQNYHMGAGRAMGNGFFPRSSVTGEVVVGNLENDGHGMLMLTRYQRFLQSGKDLTWLRNHWSTTIAAAEWICWQLDNPLDIDALRVSEPDGFLDLHFSPAYKQPKKNCLWSENESAGYGACEIWSNFACYAGLIASADMAEAMNRTDLAERYHGYADRLRDGMVENLTFQHPVYGTIWAYIPDSSWTNHCETLAPLIHWLDLGGMDVAGLDKEILEISRRSYEAVIHHEGKKNYSFVNAYAYGQSFIIQAALQLDYMEDATRLIETAARYIYSPHYHSYVCPEGTIVHESGRYWFRQNALGNEVQISSVIRFTRLMAGIDPRGNESLRLMPRLPIGWKGMNIKDIAFNLGNENIRMEMQYTIMEDVHHLKACFSGNVDSIKVRMGPFGLHQRKIRLRHSGDIEGAMEDTVLSGDSRWLWIELHYKTEIELYADSSACY